MRAPRVQIPTSASRAGLLLAVLLLAGCAGSPAPPPPPAADEPVPDPTTDFVLLGRIDENGSLGIWVRDGLLYASGPAGLRIHDLRDPGQPQVLASELAGTERTRDVEVFAHANGRLYAAMPIDSQGLVHLVDVTDPREPRIESTVELPGRAHTVSVVPGTAVVYVSRSTSRHIPAAGATGQMDVIDYTDPSDPVHSLLDFPAVAMTKGGVPRPVTGLTCHEITQYGGLAYCAAVSDTLVFDTSDPVRPTIVQVIDNPAIDVHHSAYILHNGTVLALGTETAGVVVPVPACQDAANAPISGFWFYDVSDLAAPTPVGFYSAPFDAVTTLAGYCGPHLADFDEERHLMAASWYGGGHFLVDISDFSAPKTLAHYRPEGLVSAWEARFVGTHVAVADTRQGIDLLG